VLLYNRETHSESACSITRLQQVNWGYQCVSLKYRTGQGTTTTSVSDSILGMLTRSLAGLGLQPH